MTSNNQKEAKSKRKPPSEPICCTTTGRSAANSLAQTIGAASLSTREAQVKSTASPPHLRERRSQPRSAAGEPTPPSAPQAGILRSGPRATRFGAAALLFSLGCRSCCSQQRSSSSACRSRACERACFTSCFRFFACFFSAWRGRGRGAHERRQCGRSGAGARFLPRGPRGPRREAPTVPQRGTLRNFWPSRSAGGGSWGL